MPETAHSIEHPYQESTPHPARIRRRFAWLSLVACLPAIPLAAQTPTIGGGSCNSGSLNGTYAVSITGRQVTAATSGPAVFTSVLQANGSATFDGLSKVTISLTTDTNQAAGSTLTWSGTYSVQTTCAGVMNISTGGSATLNLSLYDSGVDFLISGSDATYIYSGSGLTQPSGCSLGTFSGVYTLTGTGFALSGTAVSGAENGTGLLQFDGQGHVTVNITTSVIGSASNTLTLTGTYTASSTCLGSAALTDTSANSYVMNFSIYNMHVAGTAFYATLQSSQFLIAGSGHALYGQPASSSALGGPRGPSGAVVFAQARQSDAVAEERA
jgi:hypothetical protein